MIESIYHSIYEHFNGNEVQIALAGNMVVSVTTFGPMSLFFLSFDLLDMKWTKPYKVQDNTKISMVEVRAALPLVLFNQFVITPIFTVLVYYLGRKTGMTFAPNALPSFTTLLLQLAICFVAEEVFFYYSHRLFHHPRLYKHIHKIHHRFTSPTGMMAIYAHPIEHVVSNLSPVVLGPLICGAHITVVWLWVAIVLLGTCVQHSGYHLPFLPSPEFHDYHHMTFSECFSAFGILDGFHGTDKTFRQTVQNKRNFTSFSATPLRVLIPAKKKE